MDFLQLIKDKVFIIAEIGNNHNGNADTAKELIDAAVDAGADAVKFQSFRGEDIVTPKVLSSEYPGWNVTEHQYWCDFLDTIALPLEAHKDVFDYAWKKGVVPFSTAASPQIVSFLEGLNVLLYKVASMDVTNVQLLKRIAATGKPVIMSTGMAEEVEIDQAVRWLDIKKLAVLHCVSDYPLAYQNANLKSMIMLKEKYGCPVGFSDHSLTYDLPIAAVACGARIIEKHITLNRNSAKKAEHHFAFEPAEFKELVIRIRNIEAALGRETIRNSDSELEFRKKARRSLHVNKALNRGDILKAEDICVLRPSDGAAPEEFEKFLGQTVKSDKEAWDPLTLEDV